MPRHKESPVNEKQKILSFAQNYATLCMWQAPSLLVPWGSWLQRPIWNFSPIQSLVSRKKWNRLDRQANSKDYDICSYIQSTCTKVRQDHFIQPQVMDMSYRFEANFLCVRDKILASFDARIIDTFNISNWLYHDTPN